MRKDAQHKLRKLTNWVKQPNEGKESGGNGERLLVLGTDDTRGLTSGSDEDPPDVEKSEVGKDVKLYENMIRKVQYLLQHANSRPTCL